MVETIPLSLKGDDPAWGGLVDLTELAPTAGMFTKMKGCVIGKDGSEIESFPGTVLAARPRYMDRVEMIHSGTEKGFALTNNNKGVILQHLGSTFTGHGLEVGKTYTVRLRITVRTVSGFPSIKRDYQARASSPNTLTIDVITAPDPSPILWVTIQRPSWVWCPTGSTFGTVVGTTKPPQLHGLRWVNGQFAVVAVARRFSEVKPIEAKRAVAVWQTPKIDWNEIDTEEPWDYWPNPVNTTPIDNGVSGHRVTRDPTNFPQSAIYDYPPRRKCNLHVTKDDLIIAVPGHGIVLQANLSTVGTEIWRSAQYTRLLGVPKGGIFRGQATPNGTGGAANYFADGDHVFYSIGYRDRITGQVGLTSKPLKVVAKSPNLFHEVDICAARLMLIEAQGMNVIVYTSGLNGVDVGPFFPVLELNIDVDRNFGAGFPRVANGGVRVNFGKLDVVEAKSWPQKPLFPILEQFPMGSSWAVTVRGTTFYGGGISHATLVQQGPDKGLNIEQIGFKPYDELVTPPVIDNDFAAIRFYHEHENEAGIFPGQFAAGFRVPSSYQGTELHMPVTTRSSSEPKGWNIRKARLNLQENDLNSKRTLNGSERGFPWSLDDVHFINKALIGDAGAIDVILNRGHVQFSELGFPGITPSTNRIIFDRIKGIDTRAAGRLKDSIIVCTEEETYRLSWGRSPLGSDPILISDTYGCIAPNSMVEFPGGLAWLSKDGPVVCDGAGVHWIGVAIFENWSLFQRDSAGLMPQAFGAYDTDKLRIIWGVRRGAHESPATGVTFVTTQPLPLAKPTPKPDDEFALTPNDTLMVYNTQSRGFSLHEVLAGREIIDMDRMPDEKGNWRMMALEEDGNIYQFDSRFMDHTAQTRTFAIDEGVTFLASATSGVFTVEDGDDNVIPKGTKLMVTRAGEVLFAGVSGKDAFSAGGRTFVTVDHPENEEVVILKGDTLEVDIVDFEIETTFKAFGGFTMKSAVNSLVLLHTTKREYPVGAAISQFAAVTIFNPDGEEYRVGSFWGQPLTVDHRTVYEQGWGEFALSRIRVHVFGNSFTKLKDLVLELTKAG